MPIFSSTIQDHVSNTMPQPYYRFDGVDDYISIADSDHLSFGDGTNDTPFSVTAWIYCEDASDFYIASKLDSGNQDEWVFSIGGDDKLSLYLEDESRNSYQSKTAVATTSENTWIHVACTYDGTGGSTAYTGITLYENGTEITNVTYLDHAYTAMENLGSTMTIGALREGTGFSQGSISDVKIYNLELSATEVKELYSGASVPWKYKGAGQKIPNQTDRDFSGANNWTNSGLTTFNSTNNELEIAYDSSTDFAQLSTAYTDLEVGMTYTMSFTVASFTGNSFRVRSASNWDYQSGGAATVINSDGDKSFEFTVTSNQSGGGIRFKGDGTGGAKITNVSVKKFGAVAEYDGSGIASDKWFDKSGNDLHGTVDGATVENAPSDTGIVPSYEEGTWTPNFYGSSGGSTTFASEGKYTRIGNQVTCRFDKAAFTWNSGYSGNLYVSGLPFTGEATSNHLSCATDAYYYPASTWQSTNECGILFLKNSADSTLYCRVRDVAGDSDTGFPATRLNGQTGSYLGFMFTYHV